MLFSDSKIYTESLKSSLFNEKEVELSVTRLDLIHPVVSGNKLFKLHYFLEDCIHSKHKTILTFGGAYSNHLVATAFVCNVAGLKAIGIVRGEKPERLSHTLEHCIKYGMILKFISRVAYENKDSPVFLDNLINEFGECTVIPEGGYHPMGASGATLIHQYIDKNTTHICCAIGTATTIGGLLIGASDLQKVIAVPVLKGLNDLLTRLTYLTNDLNFSDKLVVNEDAHFGGYAKKTPLLTNFMNELYSQHALPTDFVYTAKMMWGVFDMIRNNHFPKGSRINCIHSGGLQGNASLPNGTLIY